VAAGWWLAALALPAAAQTAPSPAAPPSAEPAYVPTMTFEVASVRQSQTGYSYTVSGFFTPHTSTLRVTNWSIENLLSMAYGLNGFYQISGVPDSFRRVVFNVQAKANDEADEKLSKLSGDQQWLEQQHMVQVLLAERFHLQAHWETKDGEIYNMMSKGRTKLREANGDPPSDEESKAFGGRPIPPLYQQGDSRNGFDFVAHGCSMETLAKMLTAQFGRPVVDKTGLAGKYDFVLRYYRTRESERDDNDPSLPLPLETALQDTLGLKLEPAKGPVSHLVIDHVEKPTEN
jgi:uncharacterized protein (TIGR03435 family)